MIIAYLQIELYLAPKAGLVITVDLEMIVSLDINVSLVLIMNLGSEANLREDALLVQIVYLMTTVNSVFYRSFMGRFLEIIANLQDTAILAKVFLWVITAILAMKIVLVLADCLKMPIVARTYLLVIIATLAVETILV